LESLPENAQPLKTLEFLSMGPVSLNMVLVTLKLSENCNMEIGTFLIIQRMKEDSGAGVTIVTDGGLDGRGLIPGRC
jgi:hypothetical protein